MKHRPEPSGFVTVMEFPYPELIGQNDLITDEEYEAGEDDLVLADEEPTDQE